MSKWLTSNPANKRLAPQPQPVLGILAESPLCGLSAATAPSVDLKLAALSTVRLATQRLSVARDSSKTSLLHVRHSTTTGCMALGGLVS